MITTEKKIYNIKIIVYNKKKLLQGTGLFVKDLTVDRLKIVREASVKYGCYFSVIATSVVK